MKILAIETSCDETAVAIVEKLDNGLVKVLGNPIRSSQLKHIETGGIVPEVAAREQIKAMTPVILEAIKSVIQLEARDQKDELRKNRNFKNSNLLTLSLINIWIKTNIDAIAVTQGPGLIGSLLVGVETAKTLALAWRKPLIPVNHLLGHLYANWIESEVGIQNIEHRTASADAQHQAPRVKIQEKNKPETNQLINQLTSQQAPPPKFPLLALTVSGGHTSLVLMKNHTDYQVVGQTLDDAAGECFDKCARAIGYSYPGGPHIATLAEKHKKQIGKSSQPISQLTNPLKLPRPLLHEDSLDMSFSGLKAAFVRQVRELEQKESLTDEIKQFLAYDLELAIAEVLVKKVFLGFERFNPESFLLAGGVSANKHLRRELTLLCQQHNRHFYKPELEYCMDNAAMIGAAAMYHSTPINPLQLKADPGLSL